MILRSTALGAMALALALPATAGGLAPAEPSPEVAPVAAPGPMTGDWTGFYGGAQIGYGDVQDDLEGDGAIGGVHAGYRHDFGRFVAGAEADYDVADIDLGGGDSLDGVARLKLQGGYDLGDALVYGTAGVARANASVGGADRDGDGWLLGLGAAYQIRENWTVGGEILGHRFEDFDDTGLDVDAITATARVSFRF